MNILIYGDTHFSQYSSILRKRGNKYSVRLENEVMSINWAERLAESQGCDMIVCLGDFFDSPNLNAEELTALSDIQWANIPHYFLVGNHEIGSHNLDVSSSHLLSLGNMIIESQPIITYYPNNLEICYLPYVFEEDRKFIYDTFAPTQNKRIIFSHNDIKGVQMGAFVSVAGYGISEIENNCSLFINGHLHNGGKIGNKIINCGNLTGQNFSEDAFKYDHVALVLDTDTLKVAAFENPYALNFYKIENIEQLNNIKNNSVLTIRCAEEDVSNIRNRVDADSRVLQYKLVLARTNHVVESEPIEELNTVDHLKLFKEFILKELGESAGVIEELNEVCI